MKPRLFPLMALALALLSGAQASAQIFRPLSMAPPAPVSVSENSPALPDTAIAEPRLTPEQLEQLLGPIALYPDPLIALILPSATVSSDIVLAARYLSENSNRLDGVENQPWDDSVKALTHYPDVVKWMDQNLPWTKQLGEAFLQQPAEVMKAMQRLRVAARAAGTLVDTPQQQVIAEAETIYIVPAQPDVIYVPYYDPQIVYLPRRSYYSGSFFSFSIGYPVGHWLGYHMDWHHCRLWTIDRHSREHYWRAQRDWRRPTFTAGFTWTRDSTRRPWTPHPVYSQPGHRQRRYVAEIARPSPTRHERHDHEVSPVHRNIVSHVERATENRGASSRTHQRSAASWANRVEPRVVSPQVQAPQISVPTDRVTPSRDGRGSHSNDHRQRENLNRGRSDSWHGPNRGSSSMTTAPARSTAPAVVQPQRENHGRSEAWRGGNRGSASSTVAPAPTSPRVSAPISERTHSVPERTRSAPESTRSASRGDRQHHATPVASEPQSESSESRSSQNNGGHRGHRSHTAGGRH